jgi:hypothetical protein
LGDAPSAGGHVVAKRPGIAAVFEMMNNKTLTRSGACVCQHRPASSFVALVQQTTHFDTNNASLRFKACPQMGLFSSGQFHAAYPKVTSNK